MGRPAKLEPRWLVGLLNRWAIRDDRDRSKGIGYYTTNPMLRAGMPMTARTSHEPMDYSEEDFVDVQIAVDGLDLNLRMAVVRYFKPWAKHMIDAELQRSDDTWMRWLKDALSRVELEMDRKKAPKVLDTLPPVRIFCPDMAD